MKTSLRPSVSLCVALFCLAVGRLAHGQSVSSPNDLRGIPPRVTNQSRGRLISSDGDESSRFPASPQSPQPQLTPSITPTGIKIVGSDGTATNALAGVPFWVQ